MNRLFITLFIVFSLSGEILATQQGQGKGDIFTIGYDDLQGTFNAGTGAVSLNTITMRDSGFPILAFDAATDSTIYQQFQMSQMKKLGDNTKSVHLHAFLDTAPNAGDTAIFDWKYTWINNGNVIPVLASWNVGRTTHTFSGTEAQYSNKYIVIISSCTAPVNEETSSLLFCIITRDSTGAGSDTYAGNVGIATFPDTHISKNKIGTYNETSE